MTIVLDTNVLVAGLLSPSGPPGDIVRLVAGGDLTLCLDARVLGEYEAVLHRPRFRFDPGQVAALLDYVVYRGLMVSASPLPVMLPDRDDEPFLELAVSARAECLVTGNLAHFPGDRRCGVTVVSPAQFITAWRQRATGERDT